MEAEDAVGRLRLTRSRGRAEYNEDDVLCNGLNSEHSHPATPIPRIELRMPDVQIDPGIKASEATVELHKIHEGLKLANTTIDIVHGPISEILVVITRIDRYVGDALSFLNFTDDILAILHDAIKFCQYLGELIPEVGPILAEAASFIENLHIEQTVKAIVDEVRRVVKEVSLDMSICLWADIWFVRPKMWY